MGSIRFPSGPAIGSDAISKIADAAHHARGDRRAFLARAAGLGLAIPVMGGLGGGGALADEHEIHDDDGYVGSDGTTEGGTGDATPDPDLAIEPHVVYDPHLPPVEPGTKDIVVDCIDKNVYVSSRAVMAGWTFDGTIPGRTLRVVEGDTINFTLKNSGAISHSLDFHSAKTPPEENYPNIQPGEEFSFTWEAKVPGAYMYHCGTPPVLYHIGAGMYGAMIVDPKEGWSPAQELIFVQSEFYLGEPENGVAIPDYTKMANMVGMDHVVFNGYANQYVENPINVRVGEPIRIFVVNAGPNVWTSFHVVGAIFDKAYVNAHPKNELFGLQSISIGPGDGACVEFTLEEPGTYVAVNHAFGHAAHGAIALLNAR